MVAAQLKDKIPPHNDDAERATIGAVLLNADSVNDIIYFIRASDFYKTAHQKIFQAILTLSNTGQAIDLITLVEQLKSTGELEKTGGAAYISSLTSSVPTSANVNYYAKIVRNCSVRRKLLHVASEIIRDAHDDSHNERAIVELAEKKIYDITDEQSSDSYKSVKEILSGTIETLERLYNSKESCTGIPSGFSKLDAMTNGFQNSELIIIGARPSMGKTALALTMASHIAIHQNIATGFFTLEMADELLMQRILSGEARIDSSRLRSGFLRPSDFNSIFDAAGNIYEAPLFIHDTPNMKLLDLRAQARRMKSQQDIKIMFVDYITLIGAENTSIARHEQIAETSRSLKSLARELNIPIIALSQVKRETEGKEPTLADLRESGSIEQDADVVMFLHRDRGIDGKGQQKIPDVMSTELIIAKQRNGPIGKIEIAFIPRYAKFESMSHEKP